MDLSHCRQKLGVLLREETVLARQIMAREPLLKGTISKVKVKCGKKNCKCVREGKLHIVWRITRSNKGKTQTKSLCQSELMEKYKGLTDNYRRFRRARARLVKIQREALSLINRIERGRCGEYGLKFGQ